ncbi:uncharacterized protein RJT20DRAFT_125734 [Scheffersomyces xylosifermentans]|uniref:uncharacterized protein n=1 Tax=Scheffersomyces xylosifermentans TaxID=1304137 RepID=UPI00315DBF96
MKISKWKRKYGKWEMITVNENLFAKIVVNYEVNKSWLTFFKEEIDEEGTELDKPVLILSLIEGETTVRHTALDLQVNSINAITKEKMQIMIRCTTGALGNSILTNIKNVLGVLSANARNNNYGELKNSELSSAHVAAPSLSEKSHPSASTTYSSFNSTDDQKSHTSPSKLRQENSTYSINSEEAPNFNVIKNPDNSKLILLNNMTIRLQEQLESYEMKNTPSSWKILSMYSLSVFSITDNISKKAYFNFVLENTDKSETAEKDYNWLICDSEIDTRMERIGKAGFLVKVDDDSIFMIECKGKKQSIQLLEIFR